MRERDTKSLEIGVDILPFEMGYLPEIYQKKAEVELNETPDRRVQCIQQLKEMLKSNNHTKDINFNEDFLLQNLRARKFNVDRAHKNVNDLLNLSKKNPIMFRNFNYDVSVIAVRSNFLTILPWRCHEGCTILAVELDKWKLSEFSLDEVQRMLVILLLQSLQEPMTQVNGIKVLFNVKTSSLKFLRYCTPHFIYLLYHGTQECAPTRYRGIHIVNNSIPFKTGWFVLKPFLSDKIRKRIYFHSTPDTLFDHFPRAVVPTSFGGDLKDYDQSNWLKRAMEPQRLAAMVGGCLKHLNGAL